jgi:MinD superfamily P-loop ATPase
MPCQNCGSVCFVEAVYVTAHGRLPALACERCGVLELNEALGATVEERTVLRWAIVARTITWRPLTLREASDVLVIEVPRAPRLPSMVQ